MFYFDGKFTLMMVAIIVLTLVIPIDILLFLNGVSDLKVWVSGKKLNATLTTLIPSLIRP